MDQLFITTPQMFCPKQYNNENFRVMVKPGYVPFTFVLLPLCWWFACALKFVPMLDSCCVVVIS